MMENEDKLRDAWNDTISFPIVVSRKDIPVLTHVLVDGINQPIGEVYDFRAHPELKALMPNEGRASIAWVKLGTGEIHTPHFHPVVSMVVVCEGEGRLIGDVSTKIAAGDIVMIPAQASHGFVGDGVNGFWGLSLQFEGNGLYEIPEDPRMSLNSQRINLDGLRSEHASLEEDFRNNKLLRLVQSPSIHVNTRLRDSLLDVLHVWSNEFQKLIKIRASSAKENKFIELANQHLEEEIGHNEALAEMRNHEPLHIWDPTIDAVSSWFSDKMANASDVEATILMHLVIEGAGNIFHAQGALAFPGADHFEQHGIHDDDHAEMGWSALESTYFPREKMQSILSQGWKMMNLLCNRMAEVACERAGCSDELVFSPDTVVGSYMRRDNNAAPHP